MSKGMSSRSNNYKCKHCGNLHKGICKYVNYKCSNCNKIGHLAKICRSKKINYVNEVIEHNYEEFLLCIEKN